MEESALIRRLIYALTNEKEALMQLYRRTTKALRGEIMYEFKIAVDNTDLVLAAADHQIKVALESIGAHAQEDVAQRAPVDTGRLKNSIKHKTGDRYVDIYTNVEYAGYQEFGTSKIPPKHYMKNGIESNLSKYKEILEKELKG